MKTGVELIAEERLKQIEKHGFTGEHHAEHPEWYEEGQMIEAACYLLSVNVVFVLEFTPLHWDAKWFKRLCDKPYKERLIIAGALISAEIDRLRELERRAKENV